MDILSDVNIKGELTLGGPLYVSDTSTNEYGEIMTNNGTFSIGYKYGDNYQWCISSINSGMQINSYSITLEGSLIEFKRKETSLFRSIVPHFNQITIPENCSKFFITNTSISIKDDSNIYKYFSYPLVMAYQCGKRVDIDVELSNAGRLSEIVYGLISPQAEQRELSVVYLFSNDPY